jgi:hypothetical protein
MAKRKRARSNRGREAEDENFTKVVARLSVEKRRASSITDLTTFIVMTLTALASLAGFFPALFKALSSSSIYVPLGISAAGLVVLILIATIIWRILRSATSGTVYTSMAQIRDDNLRRLITELARGQAEFERQIEGSIKPPMPRS